MNLNPNINTKYSLSFFMGDPEVTANIYCKSRNLPNTDTQNYSKDLRELLGHPVVYRVLFILFQTIENQILLLFY